MAAPSKISISAGDSIPGRRLGDQKLIFVPGEEPVLVPIAPDDLDDEWVRFNVARDEALR